MTYEAEKTRKVKGMRPLAIRTTVVGTDIDSQTGNARHGFVTFPRLPFDAVATAGDLVHNLRSALDHLAYQLVIVGSGTEPSRRVEFPIAKDLATLLPSLHRLVDFTDELVAYFKPLLE